MSVGGRRLLGRAPRGLIITCGRSSQHDIAVGQNYLWGRRQRIYFVSKPKVVFVTIRILFSIFCPICSLDSLSNVSRNFLRCQRDGIASDLTFCVTTSQQRQQQQQHDSQHYSVVFPCCLVFFLLAIQSSLKRTGHLKQRKIPCFGDERSAARLPACRLLFRQ